MSQRWNREAAGAAVRAAAALLSAAGAAAAQGLEPDAAEPAPVPIGWDAFTQWERWPQIRLGVRAFMKSTFDRTGGNHFADASHFLRQEDDGKGGVLNVALDEAGPGILWFVRHNHWHGSPWHYRVDGRETIVTESSTADPLHPVEGSTFEPQSLFPSGLTYTWSTTKGADLSWVPIAFERELSLSYACACYGTGYFVFWRVIPGIALSRPLESWSERSVPPRGVLELLARAGSDLSRPPGAAAEFVAGRRIAAHGTLVLHERGPAVLRRLAFRVAAEHGDALAAARLRVYWDGRAQPSVDAPLGLFFGTGALPDSPGADGWVVKSFPMAVRREEGRWLFATCFPMPFLESARLEVAELSGAEIPDVEVELSTQPLGGPANHVAPFHATYHDFPRPEAGRDLVLLDTREAEGGGPFCGHLVGTTYLFTRSGELSTLEGDPRFFFDDSLSPQCQGTGSEEWGGGGDYWGGRTMTLPFAGHPVGRPPAEQRSARDRIHSAYRFLLTDLMPFGRNAKVTLEHGADSLSSEHYETVTYWYGLDSAGLVLTDELDVGDLESERRHGYASPDATEPETIVSRFELGADHVPLQGGGERELFPAMAEDGRRTRTHSEFTLALDPRNLGVLLRRRLDLKFPNQRARVRVAAVGDGSSERGGPDAGAGSEWADAGTWYAAGGNTVVFADPRALPAAERRIHPELAPAARFLKTSNRRFREDEFLIPRSLTAGRSSIRVRLVFEPTGRPLHPGAPPPDEAWTELRYQSWCFVMPSTGH
jgi:hypothetical protein